MTAGRRILLVEDDQGVRIGVARCLEVLGHAVEAVPCAARVAALPTQPAFDLVLADVVLPDVPGPLLAPALVDRWPEAKVIILSDYALDELRENGFDLGGATLLQKPFGLAALRRAIEAALRH